MNIMKDTQYEELRGNAENTNNVDSSKSELVEMVKVENTPFTLIRQESEWYVTIGKYRISESIGSKEEAMEDAKRVDWERVMQVCGIMIENYNEKK